jgi:hypothetical protein
MRAVRDARSVERAMGCDDLIDFEIVPVLTSAEAVEQVLAAAIVNP